LSPLVISLIVFACVFGGALLGMFLRRALPAHHLSDDSRKLINLGIGTIATMSALVLGLLVASAKSSYDTQKNEVTEMSAKIVLVDRVLAHYGPDAQDARDLLRTAVARALDRMWPQDPSRSPEMEPAGGLELLYDKVQDLSPKNDAQRSLQTRAVNMLVDLGQSRYLLVEQGTNSVSVPLLAIVVFSLAISFMSFSLNADANPTVVITFLLGALSIAGVIFLILEMYSPFQGLIQISSAPMRTALAHLGR
jgi:uncharacterized membrane protein (DUF485 family)